MQKRRKKVPDVIRRGIRLFIGLAVCNSLGFILSSGQPAFVVATSPPLASRTTCPLPLNALAYLQDWRTRRSRITYCRAPNGALHSVIAHSDTPLLCMAQASNQLPYRTASHALSVHVRELLHALHLCPAWRSYLCQPSLTSPGHQSPASSSRPLSLAASPRCPLSALWAPSAAVCLAT